RHEPTGALIDIDRDETPWRSLGDVSLEGTQDHRRPKAVVRSRLHDELRLRDARRHIPADSASVRRSFVAVDALRELLAERTCEFGVGLELMDEFRNGPSRLLERLGEKLGEFVDVRDLVGEVLGL